MNVFNIDKDALRKAWSVEGQYWFSLKDNTIKDALDLRDIDIPDGDSEMTYLVSLGLIPYVCVSNIEVMKACVQTLSNKKLKDALSNIDDDDFVESFWKYHDIYPELQTAYDDFEDKYVIKKIEKFCEENAIKYSI